jgi:hypothetical protein
VLISYRRYETLAVFDRERLVKVPKQIFRKFF